MIADYLTKSLVGKKFLYIKKSMKNIVTYATRCNIFQHIDPHLYEVERLCIGTIYSITPD